MDNAVMQQWIDQIWKPYAESIEGPTYLLIDVCTTHVMGDVIESVKECGTALDFIPPHHTGKLQVMDVGINRPFKYAYTELCEQFKIQWEANKPRRPEVANWVNTAWQGLSAKTIVKTWAKVGLQGCNLKDG